MTMFPELSLAEQRVRFEMERQNKKWGEQNHPDLYWLAILMEEVGELAKEIIEDGMRGKSTEKQKREELVQVAAVAIQWMRCQDRRSKP